MSEKLLELSSVVNVISRTVADLEKQRQQNETRSSVQGALVVALYQALTPAQRSLALKSFTSTAQSLLDAGTSASRTALKKEIAEVERLLMQGSLL